MMFRKMQHSYNGKLLLLQKWLTLTGCGLAMTYSISIQLTLYSVYLDMSQPVLPHNHII